MESLLQREISIIGLLVVISLVAITVRRLRIPYTVALILVGLALSLIRPIEFELTPELILALFIPPLVFEAAFHLSLTELRRNLPHILVLAVPGVLIKTFIVGVLVALSTTLALPVALVFGALISATDPVAVVALFRTLNAPKRLSVLVEGESLLNDGTSIVVFNLMLGIALTGKSDLLASSLDFVRVTIGGVAVGLALGWLVDQLITRVDDHLIEATLTTVLAFGTYLLAEELHFSGVLAVVAGGLMCGNISSRGMSPTTRIILSNLWEYIAFLVNSLIFLLIGLQIHITTLIAAWQPILVAILAVTAARAAVVYGLGPMVSRWTEPIPVRWLHILSWGGLRGALSLSLALSLPIALKADRGLITTMTFGVVLFTLLVQGTTIRPLLRRLGIVSPSMTRTDYQMYRAGLTAVQAAETHLQQLHSDGVISANAWQRLQATLLQRESELGNSIQRVLHDDPTLAAEDLALAQREALRAQRSALLALRRDGTISDDVFERLSTEIDISLSEIEQKSASSAD